MPAIAFICTANRCRSVIAHAIFQAEAKKRGLNVQVYSAGVFDFRDAPPIDDTTRACLKHGTPAPDKSPTWVAELPLDSITRFFVMEQFHADALVHEFGVDADRISLLGEYDPNGMGAEVADPFSQGDRVFDKSYQRISACIRNYLDTSDELT